MKKSFCDRCGRECESDKLGRFEIPDINQRAQPHELCPYCMNKLRQFLETVPQTVEEKPNAR